MKRKNNGEGTLRPDAKKVKQKNTHSARAKKRRGVSPETAAQLDKLADSEIAPLFEKLAGPTNPPRPAVHRQEFISHNPYGEAVWLFTLALDRRDQEEATRYAAAFGLSMEMFLERFFCNDLPGQISNEEGVRLAVDPRECSLAAFSPELAKRLARAAEYDEQTAAEFVAIALETTLGVTEELFLLHPATGEMLAENAWLDAWVVEKRWIGPAWIGDRKGVA